MPNYVIYEIRNLITGRVYVGATCQFKIRIRAHFGIARRGEKEGHPLYDDLRKSGRDNFKVKVLEHCQTLAASQEAEARWVKALRSSKPDSGYNIVPGGDDFHIRAKIALAKRQEQQSKDPEAFRRAARERARRGHLKKTPEERSAIARRRFLKRSQEDRQAMSKLGALSKSPEAHRQGALKRQANYTSEQRAKIMSAMQAGFAKLTPEQLKDRARKSAEARKANRLKAQESIHGN